MMISTERQREILFNILAASGDSFSLSNAKKFRADFEELIPELDSLEAIHLVEQKNNEYKLTLLALSEIETRGGKAARILTVCRLLFNCLRQHYKGYQEKPITLEELSKLADLPLHEVRGVLPYLTQSPIWSGYTTDFSLPDAYVNPSEAILKYKAFDEIIDYLREQHSRTAPPSNRAQQVRNESFPPSPNITPGTGTLEKWSRKSERRYKWKLRAQCWAVDSPAQRSFRWSRNQHDVPAAPTTRNSRHE